jgi:hypothetical protein
MTRRSASPGGAVAGPRARQSRAARNRRHAEGPVSSSSSRAHRRPRRPAARRANGAEACSAWFPECLTGLDGVGTLHRASADGRGGHGRHGSGRMGCVRRSGHRRDSWGLRFALLAHYAGREVKPDAALRQCSTATSMQPYPPRGARRSGGIGGPGRPIGVHAPGAQRERSRAPRVRRARPASAGKPRAGGARAPSGDADRTAAARGGVCTRGMSPRCAGAWRRWSESWMTCARSAMPSRRRSCRSVPGWSSPRRSRRRRPSMSAATSIWWSRGRGIPPCWSSATASRPDAGRRSCARRSPRRRRSPTIPPAC